MAYNYLLLLLISYFEATNFEELVTLDELVHMTEKIPNEVTIVDKSVSERINLIQQLEEEDKQVLFHIIDSMLTKSKFKDFFSKNMASL